MLFPFTRDYRLSRISSLKGTQPPRSLLFRPLVIPTLGRLGFGYGSFLGKSTGPAESIGVDSEVVIALTSFICDGTIT